MVRSLFAFALLFSSIDADAQRWGRPPKPKPEWSLGLGAANFLGDLGGRNQIGSEFLWDLEISQTRPCFKASYMFYFAHNQGIRTSFHYAQVAGDDKLTTELFRSNRNLHFKSNIYELSTVYELHFVREKIWHKYMLRDKRGRLIGLKGGSTGAFLFVGVGTFYYNPKAQLEGQWYALHPLGTEGQGLPGGAKPYSRVSVAFPMGLGLRFARSRRLRFSLELGHRITLTDYIDDVSTVYYDNPSLLATRGTAAAALADPSLGMPLTGWEPASIAQGQQRGDPTDRDSYMFLTFNCNYKMKGRTRSRARRRRVYRANVNRRIRF